MKGGNKMTVQEKLHFSLKERKCSRRKLAAALNIDGAALTAMLSGHSPFLWDHMVKTAELLNISLDRLANDILTAEELPPPAPESSCKMEIFYHLDAVQVLANKVYLQPMINKTGKSYK
jgi:transcriptional regulator with XRE-family HTH domain